MVGPSNFFSLIFFVLVNNVNACDGVLLVSCILQGEALLYVFCVINWRSSENRGSSYVKISLKFYLGHL